MKVRFHLLTACRLWKLRPERLSNLPKVTHCRQGRQDSKPGIGNPEASGADPRPQLGGTAPAGPRKEFGFGSSAKGSDRVPQYVSGPFSDD